MLFLFLCSILFIYLSDIIAFTMYTKVFPLRSLNRIPRMCSKYATTLSIPTLTEMSENIKSDDFNAKEYRPIKLPVWPVWSGVIAQIIEWLKLTDLSEKIIETIGMI